MTDLATPAAPAAGPASPATPAAPAAGLAPVAPQASPSASPAGEATAPAPTPEAEAPKEPAAPGRFASLHDHPSSQHPKTLFEKFEAEQAAKKATDDKKPVEEAKPDETAKPGEEAKPAEAEKPETAEAPLTFEMPTQLRAAPEQMQEFGDLVRAAKSDPKESGQKLLDLHAKAMETYAKNVSDNQWKVWNDLIAAKGKAVLADPVIGGAGHQTAMAAIVRMRDLGVPEGDRAAFTEFLNATGAGSWPPFLRMLHRFAEIFDETPTAPGGKPARDAHIQQPSGRFASLHDHPSSQVAK
jgi:hypothetical protein